MKRTRRETPTPHVSSSSSGLNHLHGGYEVQRYLLRRHRCLVRLRPLCPAIPKMSGDYEYYVHPLVTVANTFNSRGI